MSKKMINDWEPETRSLLESLQKAGFVLESCDNGEGEYTHKPGAPLSRLIEELTACDEARLYVGHPDSPKGSLHWLYLVYGNSPGELVCDYGIPTVQSVADKLEAVCASHSEMWEGKAQPKKTAFTHVVHWTEKDPFDGKVKQHWRDFTSFYAAEKFHSDNSSIRKCKLEEIKNCPWHPLWKGTKD